jgi:hypothetical protein
MNNAKPDERPYCTDYGEFMEDATILVIHAMAGHSVVLREEICEVSA